MSIQRRSILNAIAAAERTSVAGPVIVNSPTIFQPSVDEVEHYGKSQPASSLPPPQAASAPVVVLATRKGFARSAVAFEGYIMSFNWQSIHGGYLPSDLSVDISVRGTEYTVTDLRVIIGKRVRVHFEVLDNECEYE